MPNILKCSNMNDTSKKVTLISDIKELTYCNQCGQFCGITVLQAETQKKGNIQLNYS